MPYGRDFETMIRLLDKVVHRLDILTSILVALTIIGAMVAIVRLAIYFIKKR